MVYISTIRRLCQAPDILEESLSGSTLFWGGEGKNRAGERRIESWYEDILGIHPYWYASEEAGNVMYDTVQITTPELIYCNIYLYIRTVKLPCQPNVGSTVELDRYFEHSYTTSFRHFFFLFSNSRLICPIHTYLLLLAFNFPPSRVR